MMELYTDKLQCCGCGACVAACPKRAITFVEDDMGFLYPSIDPNLCVNCGKCEKICVFSAPKLLDGKQNYYLARHKDNSVLGRSTSGGMYTAISDVILDAGGILYAPAFGEDMAIKHIRITSKKQRDLTCGSKYVQSRADDAYSLVLKDLRGDSLVVFFGTPCQVDALKAIVPANLQDKLYTVDVICNGVGSPLAWRSYRKALEQKHHKFMRNYIFRPKTEGYLTVSELCEFEDGSQVIIEPSPYKYNNCYHKGLINRPACSNCKYTNFKRVSDITIGDFSKAPKMFPEFDSSMGASMLIINSEKGYTLFSKFQDSITYLEVDQAACEQVRLRQCATFNPESITFLQNCKTYGFQRAVSRHLGIIKILKVFAYRFLKNIRKR